MVVQTLEGHVPTYPRSEGLIETDVSSPNPHLQSSTDTSNLPHVDSTSEPDYLQMIVTSRVYDVVQQTPLQRAENLSAKLSADIYLKREDLHSVFSFKIRGAYNRIAHLSETEKKAGVIACSAGNDFRKRIMREGILEESGIDLS
jgi:threonine dehydratase